jgi:outer membrane beta-barrel protein
VVCLSEPQFKACGPRSGRRGSRGKGTPTGSIPGTMQFLIATTLTFLGLSGFSATAQSQDTDNATSASYRKSTEGDDVVKNKLYPKKGRIELNLPDVGVVLNQSYVTTLLIHGGINYYFSEVWGFGVEGVFASNKDKDERACIESFYNNPDKEGGAECDPALEGKDISGSSRRNYGPAYVPIRELKYMLAANAVWNPVYGKQIVLLSATAYFDVFVTMGAGMAFSDYYPKATELRNGHPSRGTFPEKGSPEDTDANKPGAKLDARDEQGNLLYGPEGRPDVQSQSTFFVNFGVGQKYHFAKRFSFKVELRNYTLLGTESGFENFFTLWGGLGIRL